MDRGSSLGKVKNLLFYTSLRPVMGPIKIHIQWVWWLFPWRVRRPALEADHTPTSAEVKKDESILPLPLPHTS
jgi:hypothetical protein